MSNRFKNQSTVIELFAHDVGTRARACIEEYRAERRKRFKKIFDAQEARKVEKSLKPTILNKLKAYFTLQPKAISTRKVYVAQEYSEDIYAAVVKSNKLREENNAEADDFMDWENASVLQEATEWATTTQAHIAEIADACELAVKNNASAKIFLSIEDHETVYS